MPTRIRVKHYWHFKYFFSLGVIGLIASCPIWANSYILPPDDQDMVGMMHQIVVGRDTTLSDQARHYNVGFNEIRLANSDVDPWLPQSGTKVVLPTQHLIPDSPREGIVLNVPEMRLYYFPEVDRNNFPLVITHPISIGRGEWETPLGNTQIIAKTADPQWRPPESIRQEHAAEGDILPKVVPAGPDNPLGKYALRLGLPGYLIHGTNKPYGIGMRVTHGCIRLYPEDIESIFNQIEIGTPVKIIHQPYKFGIFLNMVYLEAHPPFDQSNSFTLDMKLLHEALSKINNRLGEPHQINLGDVLEIARNPTGVPTLVKILN